MVKIKIVLCLIVTAFLCSTTKGMSADFEQAILNGSTFLRLGTLIMGTRDPT